MANKKFWLGILAIALVLGMTVAGCSDGSDNNGGNNHIDKPGSTGGYNLSGTISITGTAKVGQILTANTGSLGGSGSISYQWKRGNSADAINTNITNATESNYILSSADFGKYVTVSVTRSGYDGNVSSTPIGPIADVMDWIQVDNSIFETNSVKGVAYNGTNLWIAVGERGILAYSENGESWTKVDLSGSIFAPVSTYAVNINAIAYGNNKWIAVGDRGKAATSTNGTTWTAVDSSFGTSGINCVAYSNNRWIIGGGSGYMKTSIDGGETWTSVTNPIGYNAINSVAYGNNRWVAVAANGKMATSVDGQNWTAIDVTSIFTYISGSSQTVQSIYTVAYANNQWIAAGGAGIIATSTNGQNWTGVTSGVVSIKTVAYGNNKWVAAGGLGLLGVGIVPAGIAVSMDGINWTSVANTTFDDNQINGIAFGNNKWVAVGDNSKIAYANDN